MRIRFFPVIIFSLTVMLGTKIFNITNYNYSIKDFSKNFSKNFSWINELSAQISQSPEIPLEQNNLPLDTNNNNSNLKINQSNIIPKSLTPIEYNCQGVNFTHSEIELLQSLDKRRKQLEERISSISTKEAILTAAENKVNNKIEELKKLQVELEKLLSLYNQKEDAKISSLVKIYENMKPKDAAKILEELEMPILLEVIDRMKESKAAPILAQMTPEKATILTEEYAKQRQLSSNKDN